MGPSFSIRPVSALILIIGTCTAIMTACGEDPLAGPSETPGEDTSVRAPLTVTDAYEVDPGVPLSVATGAQNLLANDEVGSPAGTIVAFGGGTLRSAASDYAAGAKVSPIPGYANGSLRVLADGAFDFVAPQGFAGPFTFAYTLANSVAASEAGVTVTVNGPPLAANDVYLDASASTIGGTLTFEQIFQNDNLGHPYGALASFGGGTLGGGVADHTPGQIVSPIPGYSDGSLLIKENGRVELTPPTDLAGDFLFSYAIANSWGSSVAEVLVDLTAQPQAVDDAFIIGVNRRIKIREGHDGLMKNDDVGMPEATLVSFGGGSLGGSSADHAAGTTITPLPGADDGLLTLNADGSFEFRPALDFLGEFTFEYVVENTEGTSSATVTIHVMEPRAPAAVDDAYMAIQNMTLAVATGSGGLLDNDDLGYPLAHLNGIGGGDILGDGTDYDDGELVSPIPGYTDGSLIAYHDGSFEFTPPTDFLGEFMFDYLLTNPEGFVMAWVTVTVEEMPQIPPVAVDDQYTATGNIPIALDAAGGVILGAGADEAFGGTVSEVQGDPVNVGVRTPTTGVGRAGVTGFVTLNPDGSFDYDPPPGFTDGDDTFTYRLSNSAGTSELATVTISLSDLVWFIDNSATPGPGPGAFSNPFANIADFNAANGASGVAPDPRDGDVIALLSGTGTYVEADGVNLRDGQRLIGEGVALASEFVADVNSSAAYQTFAAAGGTAPVIEATDPAAAGINLASGNTVRGLNIGNTAGYGMTGDAIGTLTVNAVSINGAGGALLISTSGDVSNVVFDDLSSSSSTANGIDLTGVTGTLTVSAASTGITNSTGASVAITGGDVTLSYPGSIAQTSDASTVVVSDGHTGTLTFDGSVTATAGDGLRFSNADGAYTFNGTTSLNGSDAGIDIIDGSGGVFTFADATIVDPIGAGVNVDTSSPQVTYNGSITHSTEHSVRINATPASGPIVFAGGTITDNGLGILLTGNPGTEISFASDLVLNTTATPALSALDGGTLSISSPNNAAATTDGIAVQLEDTPIGTGGVTFLSISSDGGTRGIVLTNAGNGGFTVTGTGTTDASGGTIQNKTDRGIEIVNTENIRLSNIALSSAATTNGPVCTLLDNSGCHAAIHLASASVTTLTNIDISGTTAQQGINGIDVTNLRVDASSIFDAGDEVNEGGIRLANAAGTVTLSSSIIDGSAERHVHIVNTFTDGTVLNLAFLSSTLNDTQSSPFGGDGVEVDMQGTSVLNMTVDGSVVNASKTNAIQVTVADNAVANTVNITGSVFDPGTAPGKAIDLAANNAGVMNFNIVGNPTIYSSGGTAVNVRGFANAVVQGRISNNVDIQTDRVPGGLMGGNGISVAAEDQADVVVEIDNNAVSNIFQDIGIQVFSRAGSGAILDATVTNNTVVLQGGGAFPLFGIEVRADNNTTTCANVANNAVTLGNAVVAFRQRTGIDATVLLQGFDTDATTTWGLNGNTPPTPVDESNSGTLGAGTCRTVNPLP